MRKNLNASQRSAIAAQGYDVEFLEEVQNDGGVSFHTDYFDDGMTTSAIISVYDFPKRAQTQGWFRELIDQENCIVDIKIGTEDRFSVEKTLERANNALDQKANSDYTSKLEALDARADADITLADLDAARNGREVYKRLYIRLLLTDITAEALRRRVKSIQQKLPNYGLRVYPSEQLTHFKQFFTPALAIEDQAIKDKGFPMKAYALSGGYPFNQTFVSHDRGAYIGWTRQKGEVMLDPSYHDNRTQLTPYWLTAGNPRTGKSVFGKKMLGIVVARGDTVWVFDRKNEWRDLVEHYYGLHITLDGSQNRVNLLQVFGSVLDQQGNVDVIRSFNQHRVKVSTYYATLNPKADKKELELLGELITDFYIQNKMWSSSPADHPNELRVIGLPANEYPIMEDFVTFLQGQLLAVQGRGLHFAERVENILSTFKNLCQNYGDMVNGMTTVPDLSQEKLIRFDTSGLAMLETDLYNAQYFTVLSLMESYVTMNGTVQQKRIKSGELKTANRQLTDANPHYFWWFQDEADDIFNAKHPLGITIADNMMAQHGKDFFGMLAIFPGLKNVAPTGIMQDSEASRASKAFFGRFSKQAIFRLSQEDTKAYRTLMNETFVTDGQLSAIQGLSRGDALLNLVGDQATFIHTDVTAEERALYGGGD